MGAENVIPIEKSNERFKELGFSVFMVKAHVGLAQLEVVQRAERLVETYRIWRERPNSNISDVLRDIALVDAAVEDLKKAEEK
jgi:hypothetical protein